MVEEFQKEVRKYWQQEVCGTADWKFSGNHPQGSLEWFRELEARRYRIHPYIFTLAQFSMYHRRRVLEIGVGAGTDHLQFARAGAQLSGTDLTDAAVSTCRKHLAYYGFDSDLHVGDAENLDFPNNEFDLVYSFGVIHHTANPEALVNEIERVLKPGGRFAGMLYNRYSLAALKKWTKHCLLAGRPSRSITYALNHFTESPGTRGYTQSELRRLFKGFTALQIQTQLTVWDTGKSFFASLAEWLPHRIGWNHLVRAKKPRQKS